MIDGERVAVATVSDAPFSQLIVIKLSARERGWLAVDVQLDNEASVRAYSDRTRGPQLAQAMSA